MYRFYLQSLFPAAAIILAAPFAAIEAKGDGAADNCAGLKSLHIDKQANHRAAWLQASCKGQSAQATLTAATPRPQGVNASKAFGGSNLSLVNPDETFPVVTQAGSALWGNDDDGATAKADSVVVSVFNDTTGAPDSFSGISVSTNGGITFTTLNTVDDPNPFGALFTTDIGSPSVAYDENADLWLALTLTADCGAQGIGLISSATPEDSASWEQQACPHLGAADDRPVLWVDNNNASAFYGRRYIAYNDFGANGALRVLWSDDATLMTWDDVELVAGGVDPVTMELIFIRNVSIAGDIDGTDGRVYLFGMDEGLGGAGADRSNWSYNSADGGVTWNAVQQGDQYPAAGTGLCSGSNYFYMVTPNWRHMGWGQVAVGPGGIVHYVYSGAGGSGGDIGDAYYTRSADNGATWSAPIHLNTDQDNKNNVAQWQPSISVTAQGLVLAGWYDRRNTTDGFNYQYYGRLSLDNGLSWQFDQPISDRLIEQPTQFDPIKEFCFAGESNFHNSLSNDALTSWTDGRNTVPDATMDEQSQMDVYFSRVPLCPTIGVAADRLPNGELTASYNQTLTGTGGTGPYTFSLSGLLPDGLLFEDLNPGQITGTPITAGISFFTIVATDSFGCEGSEDYGLVVNPAAAMCPTPIALSPTTLLDGAQGAAEMQMVIATGGIGGPYTYTVSEGALPLGVSLDPDSGDISGVPQESNELSGEIFGFDITATDANQCTGTQAYTTNISCPMITLSPLTQLPDANSGFYYVTNVTANGGTEPYIYFPQVSVQSAPRGIFYAEGGTIFGVNEQGNSKNFTIVARDANGCQSPDQNKFRLDSKACPPGALFCDNKIDLTGDPLASPPVEPNFTNVDLCGGSDTAWHETQGCPSSGDAGHTGAAHGRWGIAPVDDGLGGFIEDCTRYATGPAQNVLQSIVFDVENCGNSGNVALNFNYLISFEDDATSDRARVEIIADGGVAEVIADNGPSPDPGLGVCGGQGSPGLSNLKLWSGWQHFEGVYPASSTFQVNFIAETEDGLGNTGEGFYIDDFKLQCECPAEYVMFPAVLPNAALNTAYAESITTEGGVDPVTFGTPPGVTVPVGLTLDKDSGALFGVPTTAGVFPFRLEATDDNGCLIFTNYNLIVGPPGCPSITFSPLTFDDGIEQSFYSAFPVATGGVDALIYIISAGVLPPGLSLNTGSGAISGTPTTAGVYPFTVSVVDVNVCDGSQEYNINIGAIGCPTISFLPTVLPNPDTRLSYSEMVNADGGAAPYSYSVSAGILPLGLTLDPDTGEISGDPTSGGGFSFEITALDINGCFGVQTYTLDVFGCAMIVLSPDALPTGVNSLPYSQTLSANGGVGVSSFAVTSGVLPDGLTLDSAGKLTGTPTLEGSFSFEIGAADENGCTGVQSYNILIDPPPCPTITLAPLTLTDAEQNASYSQTLTASGGMASYSFNVSSGMLPTGLSLDAGTGVIGGVPTDVGSFSFDITTQDANGCIGFMSYSILVRSPTCPGILLSPPTLSAATFGAPYNQTVIATGGATTVYDFSVSAGALPAGLSLDSMTGAITGNSTSGGTFAFDITATDINSCTGTMSYSILVTGCPTITLTPGTLPNAVATVGYSQAVSLSGSTVMPFAYSISNGALPNGLTLDTVTGEIAGAPDTSGVYNFDITARDGNSCTGVNSYTLIVDASPCSVITIVPNKITTQAARGVAYSQPLLSSGGSGVYSYSVSAGALPDGLILEPVDADQTNISGTATVTGIFSFDITSQDSNGCTGVRSYTLVASESGCPTITLSPATLAGAQETVFYSATVAATGDGASYSYNVTANSLPSGLSLNSSTGEISGTPTAGGVFSFDITAGSINGCFGTRTHSLTVTSAGLEIIFKDSFEDPTP